LDRTADEVFKQSDCRASPKGYYENMTAADVIEDIKLLPREEQSRVVEFAMALPRTRQLSGEELGVIAQKMLDTDDPAEKKRLEEELTKRVLRRFKWQASKS
jgi:hypothetical protein